MKLDLLAFGAHPDDVELSCAGTILKHIHQGKKAGIIDLTQGELGTRGSAAIRMKEAAKAAKILGVSVRENLCMADGFFSNDRAHQELIIQKIRQYRPFLVLCNAVADRHPDHGRSSQLVSDACYLSGLQKLVTKVGGKEQQAWRPAAVYHYVQDRYIKPDILVDITPFMDKKMEAIQAFASQFYDKNSKEAETPISSKNFFDFVRAKMRISGRDINVEYAEAFTTERSIGVHDLFSLI